MAHLSAHAIILVTTGLTLFVGGVMIAAMQAYLRFGERAADLSSPDADVTGKGLLTMVREGLYGPGFHRAFLFGGMAMAAAGAGLQVARVVTRRAAKRRSDRAWDELAAATRAGKEARDRA